MRQTGWRLVAKRTFDLVAATAGLGMGAPLMLAVAAAVRLDIGPSVLFRQPRSGRDGRVFEILKFRTMREQVGADGHLLPDAERLTRLGQLLRSTSLDELPQLVNVLQGDLSLVGPRPLLVDYFEQYSAEQVRRLDVLPGITGWAQVNGRNQLTWETKFELDVWYVDHWSLWLDARILALTALRVLARAGVSAEGHATMPNFRGPGRALAEA